jgi:Leucine-rich repeat (LRR) protein
MLQTLHTNKLTIVDLSCCHHLTQASSLGNVYNLNLSLCKNLEDIQDLGGPRQRILNLSSCRKIKHVNHLKNLYILDLSFCTSVDDVSELGNIHGLNLASCSAIRDFSKLGGPNQYQLDLSDTKIKSITKLIHIPVLVVSHLEEQIVIEKRKADEARLSEKLLTNMLSGDNSRLPRNCSLS